MRKTIVSFLPILLMILTFVLPVQHVQAATQAEIDAAITKGMGWLAGKQNADGSLGTFYQVAKTGFAVLKFETHAIRNCIDPLDPGYQYYSNITKGLDYIFTNAYTEPIGPQTHCPDPDTDDDGIGVYFVSPGSGDYIYETGIAMMAIVASMNPGRIITTGALSGWTYREALCDAVQYLAWAQTDSGYGEGGWNYGPMDNAGDRSDNSISGYAVLGLAYAEVACLPDKNGVQKPTGFNCPIPAGVKDELKIWIAYIQCADGGSGYAAPDGSNILRTGNLLFEMAFVGYAKTNAVVQDAIKYLVLHWPDNYEPGWRGNPASYQAMYTTMKGLEAYAIHTIDGIDWQNDFADVLIAQQRVEPGHIPGDPEYGSWPPCPWGDDILATEWAVLTLQKAVPIKAPTPVGGVWSPVNMLGLPLPWIALALIALAAVAAGTRFTKRW